MNTRIVFVYGSNMDTDWMHSRASSAKVIGRAKLVNKRMVCNKESKDNSGKANLVDSKGDVVWGVLYEISFSDLARLDQFEKNYQRTRLQVVTEQGKSVTAEVYISRRITPNPTPYDWYKKLMIKGALEHRLPPKYLEYLKQLPSKPDPREKR